MNPDVLIISSIYDFATDLVCLRLREIGAKYLRINREQLADLLVCLDPLGPSLYIKNGGASWHITQELRSIWFRAPVYLRESPPDVLTPIDQLKRTQWMTFIRSLSIFENTEWMNHPRETFQAENKPYQLAAAVKSGLKVGRTLVTNDIEFVENLPEPIVVKSLDVVLLHHQQKSLFTYTSVLNFGQIDNKSLRQAPVIFQEYFPYKYDIRVTIIGDSLSAVNISKDGEKIDGDWRKIPKHDLRYDHYELPEQVQEGCKVLMNKLGLNFAGIDLVESDKDIYFIEINPTGEWSWLDNPAIALDMRIARWLARKYSKPT